MSPNPAIPAKADFPDWLSPMLVKELRQGVRTRVFVAQFILLQVAMLLTISLTLLVAAGGEDTSEGGAFFWVVVGGAILVVLPLSGLNSVGGEIKANTLELIFLTRQTAFRIVAGKWLATFVQALLFVCTVLPYLVLRYFVGGINLTTELSTLGLMLVGSALLTAFATGVSAYPARLGRSLAFFGCLVALFAAGPLVSISGRGSAAGGPSIRAADVVALLTCAALLLVLLLEAGAAKIAPPAENHSAVMRLLALAALLVAGVAHFVLTEPETITLLTLIIAALVCAGAVCEEPRWILSLYRPFAARGAWGRLAGKLLYPGWHTGVWFTLLIFAGFAALLSHEKAMDKPAQLVRFIAVIGSLLFPAAVVRAIFPKTQRATALFLAVTVGCLAVTLLCAILDHNLRTSTMNIGAFLPLATFIYSLGDSESDTAARLVAVSFTTVASLIVLLIASRRPLQRVRAVEKESVETPESTSEHPVSPDAPLA